MLAFALVQVNLLTDLTPGLALLMKPASPAIGAEPPRDREEPLFSSRDMRELFSESAVLPGGALTAFAYGLMHYGPGSRAATLAYASLFTAKALHALTCRSWTPDRAESDPKPADPRLNAALATALVVQSGIIWIPGLRRLFNITPLSLTDLMAVGLTGWATLNVNHKIREKRL